MVTIEENVLPEVELVVEVVIGVKQEKVHQEMMQVKVQRVE